VTALLEIEDVYKAFGGLHALAGASLEVEEGTIAGLIGPNGSGKTTLFNVVTGYERPDRGAVRLRGAAITGLRPDVPALAHLRPLDGAREHAHRNATP